MRNIIFIAFSLLYFNSLGQIKTIRAQLLFESDQHKLTKTELDKLMEALIQTQDEKILSVNITGHTDSRGDSLYNIALSQRRTKSVSEFLVANGVLKRHIHQNHLGEDSPTASNAEELGRSKNRRVNVVISYMQNNDQKDEITPNVIDEKTPVKIIDPCDADTIITLPEGTVLVMNKCEFDRLDGCIETMESLSASDAMDEGLTTMTSDGNPLMSCGMFNLTISTRKECPIVNCFDKPIKVRFPAQVFRDCSQCGDRARLFSQANNGGWRILRSRGNALNIITVDGKEYYEYTLRCPNFKRNCDCAFEGELKKVKFKSERGSVLHHVSIGYDCPFSVFKYGNSKRRNVVKAKLPCDSEIRVMAEITNKQGEHKIVDYPSLNSLKKRYLFARCKDASTSDWEGKFLGIFKLKRKGLYRKYIIRNIDLKEKNVTQEISENSNG